MQIREYSDWLMIVFYLCIVFAFSEIGVLTANKVSTRQYKIVAPLNPEKPIKYVRKPIDYSILDDIGHGLHAKQKQRVSVQVSVIRFGLKLSCDAPCIDCRVCSIKKI